MSMFKPLLSALVAFAVGAIAQPALAVEGPGIDAIQEFRDGTDTKGVVQNRFFLKENRFEVAPQLGYVPNNPFAKRYIGGVTLAYHLTEEFAAEAQISYSPDFSERDLKGLTRTLVEIAHTGSDAARFQQPLDKVTLSAAFAARWAPLYGKINLLGETVLNFDLYGVAGIAMLSKVNYYGRFNPGAGEGESRVRLEKQGNEVRIGPHLGVGLDFFINQSLALKLDARFSMYVDKKPQYDPETPVTESRLYNNFTTTAGIAIFFPKMKPRLYNF